MLDHDLAKKYLLPLTPIPTNESPRGKLEIKVRCILFDIYGTLFISGSGDIGTEADPNRMRKKIAPLLENFKIRQNPETVLAEFFQRIKNSHAESNKKGIDFPEVKIDEIWMSVFNFHDLETAGKFALEFELITNPAYPMPHLEKILSFIRERKILLGIISNAQFFTPFLFQWYLGGDWEDLGFRKDLVFLSYCFEYAKPSSFLFNRANDRLRKLKIEPSTVLYVGNDMRNDILPAKKAGFKTALFAGDSRSLRWRPGEAALKNISPDLVITDLEQLLEHID